VADLNFLRSNGGGDVPSTGIQQSVVQFLMKTFVIVSIVGIVGSFAGMGGLFIYFRYQKETLREINEQIALVEEDLRPELVSSLVSTSELLAIVQKRLSAHVHASMLFPIFENNIHGNGYLADMIFSFENMKVTTNIVVPDYRTFAEQVRLFENAPSVESVTFDKPAISGDGILFRIAIVVKPQLFLSPQ
jgi:hypothetical protein